MSTSKVRKSKSEKPNKIAKGMAYSGCSIMRHAFLCLRVWLDRLVDFIFGLYWEPKRVAIPDLDKKHEMLKESAVSLAKKIRNKELKSEALIRACIERMKAVNPILNAITDQRFEEAIKDAQEIDRQIAKGLPDSYFENKPFLGVPFTCKESHAVSGMLHTLGLVSRRHVRAHVDAECVALVRAAGALPLAVTNVPEINKWQESRNMVFGQTCNPFHTGRTTGGSSGGEAALMASLATPIALCSDIGGSTRMPAFYCGLFGHNPTAGYTSLKGSTLRTGEHDTMASIGFVARHCEDLGPLTKVVAGDHAEKLQLDKPVDVKKVRYYFTKSATDLRVSPVCADLKDTMKKVIAKLTSEASSTDLAPTEFYHTGFSHMYYLWRYHMTKEADSFPKLLANNQGEAHGLTELFKKIFGLSSYTLAAIIKLLDEQVLPQPNAEFAESLSNTMKKDIESLLGDDGVLLFPSCSYPAPYHYSPFFRPFNFSYWGLFNALRMPVTQVPLGVNSDGIPLGIQVVAASKNDALCLAVAKHLEEAFGGFVPPCKCY